MKLIPESQLDRALEIDNEIPGHSNKDIACVLLNYVKQTKRNMILNEFMKTTAKTTALVRRVSENPIHLHDIFEQHPLAAQQYHKTKQDLSGYTNINYHNTSPLDVDMDALDSNREYDLIYTLLPYKLEQAPNTTETVISKTLELWDWASTDGTIICGPDYDKGPVKRMVDLFVKQNKYEMETYLNTNWSNPEAEREDYMFAFQVKRKGT